MLVCPHCGTKLSVFELDYCDDFAYPDICPFCGCSRKEFAKSSAEILKQIIEQRGNSILLNRKSLLGYVMDLMSTNIKEQTALKIAVGEGIGELFYDMIGTDETGINAQKYKVKKLLTESIGLTEERAEFVISAFMYALGKNQELVIIYTQEKSFCDADGTYLNLAEKYLEEGQEDVARELFLISSKTKNISAIHRMVNVSREKDWLIDSKDWIEWHKYLVAHEEQSSESAYILAMNYTYGLDTEEDINEAQKYWKKGRYYNALAMTEYIARQLVGSIPLINANISFAKLHRMALDGEEPSLELYTYLSKSGDGEIGWKSFYGKTLLDDDFGYDFYEEEKYQLAIFMGDFYAKKIEEEHKCTDFDYEIITLDWYLVAIKSKNDYIKLEAARKMLGLSWRISKECGLKVLEQLDWYSEADYLVGIEYFQGECVDRDYEKAYQLLKGSGYRESNINYLLGQMLYYGWGAEPNLIETINYFEKEMNYFASTHDLSLMTDEYMVAKCIPFLIECYYEDLLLNDSVISLEKLENLADYYEWQNASRYLYWYYSDGKSIYRDDSKAKYFQAKLKKCVDYPVNIDESHKYEVAEIAFKCMAAKSCSEDDDYLAIKDHLLWSAGKLPIEMNSIGEMLLGNCGVKCYYYFAIAFASGQGVGINKLRAWIYIKTYIEMTQMEPDNELYDAAMQLKLRLKHDLQISIS